MNDSYPSTCVCTHAAEFDFATPEAARHSYKLALSFASRPKKADEECEHLRMADLLPRECQSCAIYFGNCFDSSNRRLRCKCKADGDLLLFAVRPVHAAKFTETVTTRIVVKSVPADSISISNEDAVDDNGTSTLKAGSQVLRPYFRDFTRHQYWHKKVSMRIQPATEAVTATIRVFFDVEHGAEILSRALTLNVTIPPENELADCSANELVQLEGEPAVIEPVTSGIISACVKILVDEGWKFFRKHGPSSDDNEIITLNIGSGSVTPETATPETVERLVQDAVPQMKIDPGPILAGLQKHLKNLAHEKGSYIANKGAADGPIQLARVETQIARVDDEIEKTQQQIWENLQKTGQFGIDRKPRKPS